MHDQLRKSVGGADGVEGLATDEQFQQGTANKIAKSVGTVRQRRKLMLLYVRTEL